MIRFRALGVEFRLHVLTLISVALAAAFGISAEVPLLAMAICFHELMHILAAKIGGLNIEYIEIMWFGGAAHIGNLYSAKPINIAFTAISGPLGNFALATSAAALVWWDYLAFDVAATVIRINLTLMLFNLMPALPLDGGRVFYAVASKWLRPAMVIKICMWMAYVLAAGALILAIVLWRMRGVLNVTLVLMAVFLVASSLSEYSAYMEGSPGRALEALCGEIHIPAAAVLIAFPADGRPEEAARFMGNDKPVIFAIVENGRIKALEYGEETARRIINNAL